MRVLLDTHTLIYMAHEPERIGRNAMTIIKTPGLRLYASHTSLWELSIKSLIGKLILPMNPQDFWNLLIQRSRLIELPISKQAILKTLDLDLTHKDPFDRLLVAQATVEDMAILSSDSAFDTWNINRVW